jgi:hypothetical protein
MLAIPARKISAMYALDDTDSATSAAGNTFSPTAKLQKKNWTIGGMLRKNST